MLLRAALSTDVSYSCSSFTCVKIFYFSVSAAILSSDDDDDDEIRPEEGKVRSELTKTCLLYTSPSPRD